MIDSDELLAIGAALVDAVRSQIKYSENLDELYRGYQNSELYESRESMLFNLWYQTNRARTPHNPEEYGRLFLDKKVGNCHELSLSLIYIAKGLEVIKIKGEKYD
mgnify:FL=1